MGSDAAEAGEYELVVAGSLGPVVRHALAPYATASVEVRAVVRTTAGVEGGSAVDLVDVLALLESQGLEISRIARLL